MIYECNLEEEMKKIGDDRYEDGFEDGSNTERRRLISKYLENSKTMEEIADIMFLSVEEVKKYV